MPVTGPGPPPVITGSYQTQLAKYRALVVNTMPGTYNGNAPPEFKGLTFPEIFDKTATANPTQSPLAVFQSVAQLYVLARLTGVLGAAVTGTANATGAAAKGTFAGIAQFTSPLQLFSSGQFWIRAGEVLAGLVLVAVGLNKLAESSGLAKSIVNQVPAIKAVNKVIK